MLFQEQPAASADLLVFICDSVKQKQNEIALENSNAFDVHVGHPELQHLEESSPHVLTTIVHHKLKLLHAVGNGYLCITRHYNVFKASECHFANFAVLMSQIGRQSINSCLHILTNFIG